METRKHRWGLYFAIEDFNKPRPKRTIHDGIDISLLKDIRPVSIESIKLFVTIHGMIADVTCQASFLNTESDHIDGFFLFPVDPEACLYHFEATLCGRKIVAASREKGENHELSLLEELDGEGILLEETSSDMFTCHLGVVPSDEQVDVMFQYSIELSISPEGDVPFVFPSFVPREFQARYMDAAYSQYPGPDQQSYNVDEYSFDFYFQAIIAGNYMVKDVLSREVLEIDYLDQSHYNAKLTLAGNYLPNRDFAFTMKYADIESPHILVQKGGPESASDHVVMKNQCGLFTLFHRLNKTRPKSMKGEFIFCIDRSSTMRGHKIQVARETLLYFIKGLPMGCYFNIISFSGTTQPLFKSSRVYNQYNVMKAIKCQLKMRADMMGTNNILGLLQYIYDQPIIAGHPKQVFIITEGTESNKHECIDYITQRAEYARIFPIGIGELCQRAMLAGLARAGNGKPHFLKLNEKPYNTVLECLKQAIQPGLTNLEMEFDTPAGVTCLTIPPSIPPIVFAEEKLQIYILIKGQPENPSDNDCSVTISGTLGRDEPYSRTIYFNLVESMINENLPIHRLALKTEVKDLDKSIASALGADDILENEYQMIQAALSGNIASRFTPLVGIDAMTGQEIEGFPIIRVRAEEIAYSRANPAAASVYKSVSRLTLSRPGENPSAFVRGIFERQSGGQRTGVYSMADSRIHDFDDEVEDGLEMEYTFKRPPAAVADIDSELALSEVYMGVSDRDEWDKFKDSLKHPGGLTKFQHHDGYWMLDKKIAYAFCGTITEIKDENPLRDDIVWTTVLALNWLKVNFGVRKTEWKESEDWARAWLYQQDLEGYSLEEMLELAAGLKHLDGHMLFKPPPRPEREISTIEEDEEPEATKPPEPVTYMKQESITMIGNDLDDMAYDEYLNDEVHDIKTAAIEISATNRPLADKPTTSEDATKDHPGHLVVSPSQLREAPGFPPVPKRVESMNRHHHTTAQRQESLRIPRDQYQGPEDRKIGRYGEVIAPRPSTAPYPRKPLPSKRSSSLSLSPSSSTGKVLPQSSPRQPSESEPIPTPRSQSFNQSDQRRLPRADQAENMKECSHPNQPGLSEKETTKPFLYGPPETMRSHPHQPPQLDHPYPTSQSNQSQFDQSEASMQDRILDLSTSQPQASPRTQNFHFLEGTSHYSPLTPDRAFQPPQRKPMAMIGEAKGTDVMTVSVPANNISHSGTQEEVSGQSAPRPKVLPLLHTTSTDTKIDASPEEPNFDSHTEKGNESPPTNTMKASQSWPAARSTSRVSLRSAVSTSYAYDPNNTVTATPSTSQKKPKRSLSFKQRMKNLKDNLLYSYEIKHCKKYNDLTRMNSLRASVRSGRSPYANDYDETDALISNNKPKRNRQRRDHHKVNGESRQGVADGRSRTTTPESRSRPVTPDSRTTPEPVSRPVTPTARSRPVTPTARSRPVTPAARSRPPSPETISRPGTPEAKSRPTTPGFRSGANPPEASYFRPRTPAASEADTPSLSPQGFAPPGQYFSRDQSVPLIKPVAGRIAINYQDSPRSSFRSNQTLL